MNYHARITHHDLCRVAMDGVLLERNFLFSPLSENKSVSLAEKYSVNL